MPTEANSYYHLTNALSGTVAADVNNPDKGKPGESRGRKAMDLTPCRRHGHDCQAAEDQRLTLFLSSDGPGRSRPVFFCDGQRGLANMYNKTSILSRLISSLAVLGLMAALFTVPGSAPAAAVARQSVIVQGQSLNLVVGAVERVGGIVTSRLDVIHGVGALLPADAIARLKADPAIIAITANAPVELLENSKEGDDDDEGGKGSKSPATDYPDVTGADLVWQTGDTGQGVTVAIVDTGIARHKGLNRDVNGNKGHIVAWVDYVDGFRVPRDPNGNGTHIAGIIANSQKGEDREFNGMAPGVDLAAVRVLDEAGTGTYEHVIQGIQWVIAHKSDYNIRVMNLSLVSPVQSPYWADPLNQAVMQAWANGITVVVAGGNGGPNAMTIGVPGNNPYVITVGAFTDNYTPNDWSDDYLTSFSAAGPTLDGFVKPDVVAPGAHMVSTMLPDSYLARHHEANRVANQYFSMAGTSQAAATVSGIAALAVSKNPDLTPDQVKFRIMGTAFPWVNLQTTEALYSMWQQGTGRVNALDAVMGDVAGTANAGLDIQADLAGTQHFEGYSYYDETTGMFSLRGGYGSWAGGDRKSVV